jgi:hypothetical protein
MIADDDSECSLEQVVSIFSMYLLLTAGCCVHSYYWMQTFINFLYMHACSPGSIACLVLCCCLITYSCCMLVGVCRGLLSLGIIIIASMGLLFPSIIVNTVCSTCMTLTI